MAVAGNLTAVGGLTDGGCGKLNGGWGVDRWRLRETQRRLGG